MLFVATELYPIVEIVDYPERFTAEGGDAGGHIVAWGTPEEVAEVEGSYTGQFLREELAR